MTAATLERVTVADFLSRCDQDNYELRLLPQARPRIALAQTLYF